MLKAQIILVIFIALLSEKISGAQSLETIDFKMVQQLAKKVGEDLASHGDFITKRSQLQESFAQMKIVNKNGTKLIDEITKDIKAMLDVRVIAVKKIVKVAEELPKIHETSANFTDYKFLNTRNRDQWKVEFETERDARNRRLEFESQQPGYIKNRTPPVPVICYKSDAADDDDGDGEGCYTKFNENINKKSKEASVYLPLDVFDKDGNLTRIIHRSRGLDKAFNHNYRNEPSIGWQYFCNSTGLFRHFPATEWDFLPINTFDCRTRHWFTGAASSSKDVMILIEQSGSMKGSRLQIAVDVARNVLDTLTPNDFVNIIHFNESPKFLINCTDALIQATSSNVLELKKSLGDISPKGVTDLAAALLMAFDSLDKGKRTSANCNQAIMFISDGMEYNETIRNIFETRNWKKGSNVRIFSYLIGEQIPERDYEQVKMMACDNRGWYTQIDTVKETREQALKYIPVMSRPLTFTSVNTNPIVWTNLYVDIIEPHRTTNHDWDCRQKEVQRERVTKYLYQYDWYPCIKMNQPEPFDSEYRKFVFMTTVSSPAFERVNGMNASLMGVAAIDVPLYEFERLFQSYRLGVGGYAFVIDQNGNILTHPDFRPIFQGKILKPAYNSIDMAEVELMDDGYGARDFSSFLLELRESIIDKPSGSKFMLALQPYDDMRRVVQLRRNYFWKKINSTPFTVVVTFPEHFIGRAHIPDEIDSTLTKGKNVVKLFKDHFRLHPDWIYCRSIRKSFEEMKLGLIDPDNCEMTPEEELVYYLEKFESSGVKWKQDKLDSNETRCDKKLMNLLLFDAKVTENFPPNLTKRPKDNKSFDFDVKTSFISTHSGLLRFKVFDKRNQKEKENFGDSMKRSIDEIWYKHTTEYNRYEPDAYIYSLPFDAYQMDKSTADVTVTRSIHLKNGNDKVPIAVVGYQFSYLKLAEFIEMHCPSDREDNCYVLDHNAYIIFDPDGGQNVGKFFGNVEKKLMHILLEDKIFTSVKVYDYQAVCYKDKEISYESIMASANSALKNVLWNPLKILFTIAINFVYSLPSYMPNLMYPDEDHYYDSSNDDQYFCPNIRDKEFYSCLKNESVDFGDTSHPQYKKCLEKKENRYEKCMSEFGPEYILHRHVTKTMPFKCDKSNVVYTLTRDESNFQNKPYNECNRPFVVHKVAFSNLILLKTNRYCGQVFAVNREFYDKPETVEYEDSLFCYAHSKPQLFRNRPKSCVSKHDKEPIYDKMKKDRSLCGRGNQLQTYKLFIAFATIFLLFTHKIFLQ